MPFGRLLPAPDGLLGDGDRQHLTTGYSGIAWGIYIPPVSVWLRDIRFEDPTSDEVATREIEWRP